MTVDEILKDAVFNNAEISANVFGNKRIISDKNNGHRNKKWMNGDKEKIKNYFEKKYKINLEVT